MKTISDIKIPKEKVLQRKVVVLYDKNGCGNVPLLKMFQTMHDLFEQTYEKLCDCNCSGYGGCYMCMKGFTTQRYTRYLDKSQAKLLAGYLCGKEKFSPMFEEKGREINPEELYVQKNGTLYKIIMNKNNKLLAECDANEQNASIFGALAEALKASCGKYSGIIIRHNENYVIKAIEGECNLNKDNGQRSRFWFYALAYDVVRGEMRLL